MILALVLVNRKWAEQFGSAKQTLWISQCLSSKVRIRAEVLTVENRFFFVFPCQSLLLSYKYPLQTSVAGHAFYDMLISQAEP